MRDTHLAVVLGAALAVLTVLLAQLSPEECVVQHGMLNPKYVKTERIVIPDEPDRPKFTLRVKEGWNN